MSLFELHLGDCLEVMRGMADNSVDAVVTDPPYGLSFMGKHWDHGVPGEAFWREALRVAKPGAHLLAFGGTRTYHRLACAIEDAGWEIRDCVMWVYGSGFPKSHDVSKAIDKAAGAEREVVGAYTDPDGITRTKRSDGAGSRTIAAPATDAARQWQGWGTALKPAWEPIIVARKPLCGTVAENVQRYGTGGINVDGCRVGTTKNVPASINKKAPANCYGKYAESGETQGVGGHDPNIGRWPANVIHDGSDEVVGLFPVTTTGKPTTCEVFGQYSQRSTVGGGDSGSAARFFYCAKASKRDRDEGCEGMEEKVAKRTQAGGDDTRGRPTPINRNHHPTVKPTSLMRYLCRLVTPPGGVVLDPFMGSGSTGKAAILEGFQFVGIEQEPEYSEIARARIAYVQPETGESCITQAYAPAKPKRPDTGQLSLFDTL